MSDDRDFGFRGAGVQYYTNSLICSYFSNNYLNSNNILNSVLAILYTENSLAEMPDSEG